MKISFVKCTFVLTTVQGFPVSELDSKQCVRYHFTFCPQSTFLRPQALPNWLPLKKKKSRFKIFKMFSVANTKQCAQDELLLKYAVFMVCFSESPVNYSIRSMCQMRRIVGSESRPMRICPKCDYVSLPLYTHTHNTMCNHAISTMW